MTYPGGGDPPPIIPPTPPYPVSPAPIPAYHQAVPPAPKKRRTGLIVGLVAAAVVVLLGAGVVVLGLTGHTPISVPGVSQTMTVKGVLQINGDCSSWGYDDIHNGTEVVVSDESGKALAVGQLTGSSCYYTFTVDQVPRGVKLYGVTISHRGTLHYTEAQMKAGVALSIG